MVYRIASFKQVDDIKQLSLSHFYYVFSYFTDNVPHIICM